MKSFHCFWHAFRGIKWAACHERNFRWHVGVSAGVLSMGGWLSLQPWEWLVVILCIALVLSLELLNTALEKLADALHPERHPGIGLAKDLAAGAVLMACLGAVGVGSLIFGSRIWEWFRGN